MGAGKAQDNNFPRGSKTKQGAAGEPGRQPQESGCLCPQGTHADGSKDKFPWLGTGLGGRGITWGSPLCLGVKLSTALTLSSLRDVSDLDTSSFVR